MMGSLARFHRGLCIQRHSLCPIISNRGLRTNVTYCFKYLGPDRGAFQPSSVLVPGFERGLFSRFARKANQELLEVRVGGNDVLEGERLPQGSNLLEQQSPGWPLRQAILGDLPQALRKYIYRFFFFMLTIAEVFSICLRHSAQIHLLSSNTRCAIHYLHWKSIRTIVSFTNLH